MPAPIIFGLSGLFLTQEEERFFKNVHPAGYVLFKRNIDTPAQVRALTKSLHALHHDTMILIDQEGGRVARLGPPHWPTFPSQGHFGMLWAQDPEEALDKAFHHGVTMGSILKDLGITVNCTPVLDIFVEGAHAIMGDRTVHHSPAVVAAIGQAIAEGHMESGILPIMKHIPGHGRAQVDSHEALPIVDTPLDVLMVTDFAPFKALSFLPIAMTAHIIYTALDPQYPASASSVVILDTIRRDIGFKGLLICDDISMKALKGSPSDNALACLKAGCDLALLLLMPLQHPPLMCS
jgi:beta-N-acetylhexosaminidase